MQLPMIMIDKISDQSIVGTSSSRRVAAENAIQIQTEDRQDSQL